MITNNISTRLTGPHYIGLRKTIIDDFWNGSFDEVISINDSDYLITEYEEVEKEDFNNSKNVKVFYLVSKNNIIIGLGRIEIIEDVCQITFFAAENYRQIGMGTELCKLLIQKCWHIPFINKITLKCSDYNVPSEEIAQKSGFSFTGYSGVGTECNGLGCLNYTLKRPSKK